MSTEQIRKIINLLEGIDSKESLNEFELPEFIPGSKRAIATREQKVQDQQDRAAAEHELETIKANSYISPVWLFFHDNSDESMKQEVKDAARLGNFQTYFVLDYQSTNISDIDDDATGRISGYLEGILGIRTIPTSYLFWKGQLVKSEIHHTDSMWGSDMPRTPDERDDRNEIIKRNPGIGNRGIINQMPNIANNVAKIIEIVQDACPDYDTKMSLNEFELPEFIPWSKKAKDTRKQEELDKQENAHLSQQAHAALENIKQKSQTKPVWVFYYSDEEWHGANHTKKEIQEAAKIGNFQTYFIQADWAQPVKGDDLWGPVGSCLVGMLRVRSIPSSMIFYRGKIVKVNVVHGISWSAGMGRSDEEKQEIQDQMKEHPGIATSTAKILAILKDACPDYQPLGFDPKEHPNVTPIREQRYRKRLTRK